MTFTFKMSTTAAAQSRALVLGRQLAAAPCSSRTSTSSSSSAASFSWAGLVREQVVGLQRPFLVVRGAGGFAACGYVNIEGAAKVGDACATFTGVATHDDILDAQAVAVTPQAAALGARAGMRGRAFLELVRGSGGAVIPPTPAAELGRPIGSPADGAAPFDWSAFECTSVPGLKRPFLVIKSARTGGYAGCGYMSTPGATKCGDAFALFHGVSVHHDILDAKVIEVSQPAKALGARAGMRGREFLDLIR
jgi:uncharacterized protein YunC (DUF1805 family)